MDPLGYYNASKALEYASKWWNSFNPSYKENEYDCANFVSQCLYAGNMAKMNGIGKYGWHHYVLLYLTKYDRWGNVVSHIPTHWQISDAWGIASKLYKYLVNKRKYSKRKIETVRELNAVISSKKFSKGDVAFFATDSGIYHAVIIGSIVNTKSKKNIYYFAHTSPRNGYVTKGRNAYGFKEVIEAGDYVYIVEIN